MRTIIPANTYPVRPSVSATFWQFAKREGCSSVAPAGTVPVWITYHDGGGPGRFVTVLIVRVLPTAEVVLVGDFREELVWQETERVMKERRSMSRWAERVWVVSHVVYLAQPSKREPTTRPRKRSKPWFARFCNGRLRVGPNRSYMLAYVPVPRLKVKVTPNKADESSGPDVEFSADRSKRCMPAVTRFLSAVMEIERPEQDLVHQTLGHLLGGSYVAALSDASTRFSDAARVGGPTSSANYWRSLMCDSAEAFKIPRWLDPPPNDEVRSIMLATLAFTRFPMGDGPDPEFSVRPWLPEALEGIVGTIVNGVRKV